MPRLEDIQTNFLDMDASEARTLVRKIREDRVIRKLSRTQKVAKVRNVVGVKAALETLSPAELATLFEEFE